MKRKVMVCMAMALLQSMGVLAETVTIHVQQAPISAVLRGIANIEQLNIVVDDSVKGTISADLTDIEAEKALAIVADMKGLRHEVQQGVHIFRASTDKEVHVYPLSYVKPTEVVQAMALGKWEQQLQPYEAGQAVIAYGTAKEQKEVERVLQEMDKKQEQVQLEVEVVAVNKENVKELGIDWDWQSLTGSASYERESWTVQEPVVDSNGDTVFDEDGIPRTKTLSYNDWRITGPEGYGSIQFGRSVSGHPYSFFFRTQLKALEAQGKATILAKPRVMTLNGKEAHILIGDKVPVLTEHIVNGEVQRTTEYTEAGIQLRYTPHISPDGYITATIHAEVSTPLLVSEMKAYHIVTRQADTEVRMANGETLIIGGLIDKTEMEQFRKVPLLGDIPLLGKLFQSKHTSVQETEVLIFLRPLTDQKKEADFILPEERRMAYDRQDKDKMEKQSEE